MVRCSNTRPPLKSRQRQEVGTRSRQWAATIGLGGPHEKIGGFGDIQDRGHMEEHCAERLAPRSTRNRIVKNPRPWQKRGLRR